MNHGPLIFLAAFFGLSASWFGFVLSPQIQLGRGQPETSATALKELYPQGRPGLARQGAEVYRANGCFYCHSQQVGQTGTLAEIFLTDIGTNPVAVAEALVARGGVSKASPTALAAGLPKSVWESVDIDAADAVVRALKSAGAKAELRVVPLGPDIARNWGRRRTVAQDFLFDSPVMPGSQRAGPDLANIGLRQPDPNWHLRHLYDPRSEVEGSTMPRYRFLFEQRKIAGQPSPDALQFPDGFAPEPGFEIVPTPEAQALAAYLLSLRAYAPLYEAPLTIATAAAAPATNAPAP